MNIAMQAVRITESTYPVAVAVLGVNFASIPYHLVHDHWLVINRLDITTDQETNKPVIKIDNFWINKDEFKHRFALLREAGYDYDNEAQFSNIIQIRP